MDEPINFTYEDTDTYQNEISELYSYGEESEFFANRNAFEESMEDCGLPLTWKHMVQEQKSRAINYLMTTLEVSCRSTRIKSCRALAYLIQGNFGECLTLEEQAKNSQDNVFLLYEQGLFQAFAQQLLIEANLSQQNSSETNQQQQQGGILTSQLFTDSSELRLILSVLCTITETMYHAKDFDDPKIQDTRQQFIIELQSPIGDELLSVSLFQMLNSFCGGLAPHFPVRKITLLLWKVILITLGGTQTLRENKEQSRKAANLEPSPDETFEVTKTMRPCSPTQMPDGHARARAALSNFVGNKRKVFKQPAFDDAVFAYAKECLLNFAELNPSEMENENPDGNGEFSNELNDSTETAQQESSDESSNNDSTSVKRETSDPLPITAKSPISSDEESSDGGIGTEVSDDTFSFNLSQIESRRLSEKTDTTKQEDDEEQEEGQEEEGEEEGGEGKAEAEAPAMPEPDLSDDNSPEVTTTRQSLVWTIDALDSSDSKDDETSNDDAQPNALSSPKPGPASAQLDSCRSDGNSSNKGLPWAPKVRKADLSQHLSQLRQKFLGYTLPNDLETTFGLPDPIIEGVNVLRNYLYISLSEVQLEREEAMEKYPLTHKEINPNYRDTPAEKLYNALLPRLPQYMIALLKILLAASTNTKYKERTESINIMSEVNSDNGGLSIIQTMKMNADANRHKEIITKSVSAILILLLKHFKVNHIYQFEYVSQQLMFANCIPLILKFLSQDTYSYIVSSKSNISAIDFPACVIGEQPELTTEAIELCLFQSAYCWRNMFSCINLVRILNKLTKWKHSRIMMLVVFKSAPTLSKALSVRHSMFQLYVLKLLKVQLKFLGRQWKKANMKLISAIYQKVRHRFTDDWAYSNDNEARPWDFQAEEFTLQANINKFHQRRYSSLLSMNGKARNGNMVYGQLDKFGGFDDCTDEDYDFGLGNGKDISEISPHFERNYERWLESEVFQRSVDWDKLLSD